MRFGYFQAAFFNASSIVPRIRFSTWLTIDVYKRHAYNGDIVIAMIEDEATVKRFYKEKGVFRLQPENPAMEPIIVPEVTILGKVVSLYRIF